MVMGDLLSPKKSSDDKDVDSSYLEYFERGSEWRKWDLHLHSPSSFDYKSNSSNEDIIKTLKANDISAAVITDHHKIDVENIKKLAELGKKEGILILPGIELCSELGGSKLIHFIGIFPLDNIDHVWDTIKGQLQLTDHIIQTVGNDKIICPIKKSCDLFHDLGGITTIHAGEKTNSVEYLKNYILKHEQKKNLLKDYIDILEIGKEEDITLYEKKVFPSIEFRRPLVICSDNHKINDYNLKQYCWIKADLTFEGLKQIIYEPNERVKIQETCPDDKSGYAVIDSVKFENDEFVSSEIVLNSNLVSIIGGKSTGKSIFLRSIARAIDENYVNEVVDDILELKNPYTIVKWRHGEIDTLDENSESKIKYIPQNFLNNKIEKTPDSYTNKLIIDILKSDDDHKENFLRIESCINQFDMEIHEKVTKLFETENNLMDLKKEIKELGSPDAIENQIKTLTENYDTFQTKEKISDQDIDLQKKLMSEVEALNKEIDSIETDNKALNEFSNYLKIKKTFLSDWSFIQNLSEGIKNEIENTINEADKIYKNSLTTFVEKKINYNRKSIEQIHSQIKPKNDELEPLNTRINSSDQAKEIFHKIKKERELLSLINDKLEKIDKLEENYENILKDIFETYSSFIEKLKLEKKSFDFDSTKYSNFKVELIFKTNDFQEVIKKSLNNQKFSSFEREKGINLADFKYDDENFQNDLEEIIRSILKDILKTKSGITKKVIVKKLLEVYHFINFNICEDGDKLEKMSPGKKSFALLKVLIESDESKWPILIDQPEDDLDANSISKSLTKLLKEKKKNRQIIIVSHNPNLVVGADSEQVIVANQDGSDSKNKSKKFEYVSGSIENAFKNEDEECFLYCKGIQDHICDVLEGGKESFKKRQNKYNIE